MCLPPFHWHVCQKRSAREHLYISYRKYRTISIFGILECCFISKQIQIRIFQQSRQTQVFLQIQDKKNDWMHRNSLKCTYIEKNIFNFPTVTPMYYILFIQYGVLNCASILVLPLLTKFAQSSPKSLRSRAHANKEHALPKSL